MSQYTPRPWIKLDLATAAPEMYAAIQEAEKCLSEVSQVDGDVPYWNKGGYGYKTATRLRALLARIDGRRP